MWYIEQGRVVIFCRWHGQSLFHNGFGSGPARRRNRCRCPVQGNPALDEAVYSALDPKKDSAPARTVHVNHPRRGHRARPVHHGCRSRGLDPGKSHSHCRFLDSRAGRFLRNIARGRAVDTGHRSASAVGPEEEKNRMSQQFDLADLKRRMEGAVTAFKGRSRRFAHGPRVGFASRPDHDRGLWGRRCRSNQVANITVPEPRMLAVSVWDKVDGRFRPKRRSASLRLASIR